MNWPVEYEDKVKVKGFSVLDDDFDFMACDLCCGVEGERSINMIYESVARGIKVASALWQALAGFFPDGAVR